MKIYHLKRTQFLSIPLQQAWEFFSAPTNLEQITPKNLGFEILYVSGGEKIYAGQIIRYKLKILPGIKVHWVTEITQAKEPFYFIDEQRFGPYAFWHHQHHFKEVTGGVEMTDEVNYAIPLGIIGRLAHWIFVERTLKGIFEFRYHAMQKRFNENKKATDN